MHKMQEIRGEKNNFSHHYKIPEKAVSKRRVNQPVSAPKSILSKVD